MCIHGSPGPCSWIPWYLWSTFWERLAMMDKDHKYMKKLCRWLKDMTWTLHCCMDWLLSCSTSERPGWRIHTIVAPSTSQLHTTLLNTPVTRYELWCRLRVRVWRVAYYTAYMYVHLCIYVRMNVCEWVHIKLFINIKVKEVIEFQSKHNFILYVKQLYVSTITKIKFSLHCDSAPLFSFI